MTRIWLIRHGEPAEEARHRCYGSLDVGLSKKGREQMKHVAAYLKSEPMAAIYSSPRSRAREGASILAAAGSHSVEVVDDLREISFGDFEGLTYDEIAARYPELHREWMEKPTEVVFPNGESFPDMRARVLRAFAAIQCKHDGETVAIMSHGGVNRILLADALQVPDHCIFRLAQDYGAVNLLAFVRESPVVQLFNLQAQ
jgi:alpha-ribazole phosphatase